MGYVACLPALFLGSLRNKDGIEAWKSGETICEPAGSETIYAQVDGEPVGPLPVAFRIVPDALSIVTPER
jgi:diacylglycerol kinase family enzyme